MTETRDEFGYLTDCALCYSEECRGADLQGGRVCRRCRGKLERLGFTASAAPEPTGNVRCGKQCGWRPLSDGTVVYAHEPVCPVLAAHYSAAPEPPVATAEDPSWDDGEWVECEDRGCQIKRHRPQEGDTPHREHWVRRAPVATAGDEDDGEPTEAQWLAAHLTAVISDEHGEPLYDISFENGTSLTKEQIERVIKELLRAPTAGESEEPT